MTACGYVAAAAATGLTYDKGTSRTSSLNMLIRNVLTHSRI